MVGSDRRKSSEIQAVMRAKMDEVRRLTLSIHASHELEGDPKHMLFRLSRYKFVAKLFRNRGRIMEVGCGDGLGASLVAAEGNFLLGVDIEPIAFENAVDTSWTREKMEFVAHDFCDGPLKWKEPIEAAYSLDVIEHLEPEVEEDFIANIAASMADTAPLIIGTPNKDAAEHASPQSAFQHINLHDQDSLRCLLEKHFANVFLFGMNDEVIHTGFAPMTHYVLALAAQPKR